MGHITLQGSPAFIVLTIDVLFTCLLSLLFMGFIVTLWGFCGCSIFGFSISVLPSGSLLVLCGIRLILCYPMDLCICLLFYGLRWFGVPKIRLFVRVRNDAKGCYIASVPLKQLVKLSECSKTRWSFKDGWLILEAF